MITLFLSGTKLDEKSQKSSTDIYDYSIQISGDLNGSLSGEIDFEDTIETTSKGVHFSTLKLKFNNMDETFQHSIEFLIAKENMNRLLGVGAYKVINNKYGMLNYFDGVFGYVNIDTIGELPLFAKRGKIKIYSLSKTEILGSLDVVLNNTDGQSVHIKGNFKANK
jgi:hypothetical protein